MANNMRITTQTYISENNVLPSGVHFIDISTDATTLMTPKELSELIKNNIIYLKCIENNEAFICPLLALAYDTPNSEYIAIFQTVGKAVRDNYVYALPGFIRYAAPNENTPLVYKEYGEDEYGAQRIILSDPVPMAAHFIEAENISNYTYDQIVHDMLPYGSVFIHDQGAWLRITGYYSNANNYVITADGESYFSSGSNLPLQKVVGGSQ